MSRTSLGGASISAVFWGAGGTVFRVLLQIVAQAVLARLLGPAEYGVFAIASIVVTFSAFIADAGLAYGLIQKQDVSEEDYRFAFTWQAATGLFVCATLVLLAPAIATFFGEVRATPIIAGLSVICGINAVGAPALCMLKRKLDFKTQQLGFLVSYFIGYCCIAIPVAFAGVGAWSLVIGWAAQSLLFVIQMHAAVRMSVRPLFWYPQARTQLKYSAAVLATNLQNWFIGNVDRVAVGRQLTSVQTGLYTTSYNFIYAPTAALLSVLQPVFFSASSRLSQQSRDVAVNIAEAPRDHAALVKPYLALLAALWMFLVPMYLGAAVLADSLVLTIYGAAWKSAATVVAPLSIAMPLFLLWGLSTPLLWVTGKPRSEFRLQVPVAIGWGVCSWLLAAAGGIVYVAWGVVAMFAIRSAIVFAAMCSRLGLGWYRIWAAVRGGGAVALVTTVIAATANTLLRAANFGPALALTSAVVSAIVAAVVCWRMFPGMMSDELVELLLRVAERLPKRAAAKLLWLTGRRN